MRWQVILNGRSLGIIEGPEGYGPLLERISGWGWDLVVWPLWPEQKGVTNG